MAQKAPSTRRDPRFALPGGVGFVEFECGGSDEGRLRADLVDVSVAGVTFHLDAGPSIEKGAILSNVSAHLGDCVVEGELLVKHREPVGRSRLEVGCLFYPSSQLDEEKWSAVIAGLQAAKGA
jgi:hypothetical protein